MTALFSSMMGYVSFVLFLWFDFVTAGCLSQGFIPVSKKDAAGKKSEPSGTSAEVINTSEPLHCLYRTPQSPLRRESTTLQI